MNTQHRLLTLVALLSVTTACEDAPTSAREVLVSANPRAAVVPATTASIDFRSGPAWVLPGDWQVTSAPTGVEWTVAADLVLPDGRGMRSHSTAIGRHILQYLPISNATTDAEVLVRVWMNARDGRGPGTALRHTMNGSLENGYVAYIRPESDSLEIDGFVNGVWRRVAAAPFVNNHKVWYWLRFRADGSTLRAKAWRSGTTEPAAWTVTGTDVAITSGGVGLYSYEPNTILYDAFAVDATGGTAVAPPAGPAPVLGQVVVGPSPISLPATTSLNLRAYGLLTGGDSIPLTVTWAATGGAIQSTGTATARYTSGVNTGTFQVQATSLGMQGTTPVQITTPAWQIFATGFGNSAIGQQPPGWAAVTAPENITWFVQPDASVSDGKVLQAQSTSTARHILALRAIAGSRNQEMLVRMRMNDVDVRGAGIALRHSMSGGTESAYVGYLRPAVGQIEIDKFAAGSWTYLGAANIPTSTSTWYWVRFNATVRTVRMRVWADGTPEPSAWHLTVTDDAIFSGDMGLYVYEPNTVDYDFVSAVNGAGIAPPP